MKIRNLLLAALFALPSASAFAAEPIAVESEPENAQSCDHYGEGFVYVPGTKTCVKISGEVRATYTVK